MTRNALSPLLVSVLLLLGAPDAGTAFQHADTHTAYEVARPGSVLEPDWRAMVEGGRELSRFEAQTGGTWNVSSWNPATGTPHLVWGSGVEMDLGPVDDREDAITQARAFTSRYAALLGAKGVDLRVWDVTRFREKWAVNFVQVHEGVRVVGGRADVLLTSAGRVFLFGSDLYGDVTVAATRSIDDQTGLSRAARAVPFDVSRVERQYTEAVILPIHRPDGNTYRPAIQVRHYHPDGPGRFTSYVDAATGEILWRQDELHMVDITGTIESDVQNQSYCDGTSTVLANHQQVDVTGVGADSTDASGAFSIPYGGSDDQEITMLMRGPWAQVFNLSGAPAGITATVTPGVPAALKWDDSNSAAPERDAFFFTNVVHDFISGLDPDLAFGQFPDGQMWVSVNRNDGVCPCNAWWNGSGINFCSQSGNCANTADIGDVVYHEYGHGVTDWVYSFSSPGGDLHEGNSDVMANFNTGYSLIGYGFYQDNCTSGIRNSDNTLQYPQDLNGAGHHDGQIIAGFNWDLNQELQASMGEVAGEQYAAELWHYGRKAGKPMTQPDQVMWTFAMDDIDGDLVNGTPNFIELCTAADNHNFDCFASSGVHFLAFELPEQTAVDQSYTAVAEPFSTEGVVEPSSVTMHYRVDGGPLTSVPMSQSGSEYNATIPAQFYGAYVEYYLEADDDQGFTGYAPEGAPATMWDFTVEPYFDPLEEETGWTIGLPDDDATQGIWERVDPIGSIAQPEDDATIAPFTSCFVTGQQPNPGAWQGASDVRNGKTTLTSPVWDVTGSTDFAILRYMRWYSNDTGSNGGEDAWVAEVSNDGGAWVEIENSTLSEREWKPIEVDLMALFGTPGEIQLRFVASDYGGQSVVEAAVDDFQVIADLGLTPVAVGDGALTPRTFLAGARPNPFNPMTTIRFGVESRGPVRLVVLDVSGRVVRTLVDGPRAAGAYAARWDGRDGEGRQVASGTYFVRLEGRSGTETRRVTLLK